MSLRLAPPSTHPTSTTNTGTPNLSSNKAATYPTAPSAPGLPDALRASSSSSSSSSTTTISSTHPLESRLALWTTTQQSLHHALLRRTHGLAEPLRRSMELHLVRTADGFRPSCLGPRGNNVHEEILTGRDGECSWEDVFDGGDGGRMGQLGGEGGGGSWQWEMEGLVGMGKW